AGARPGAKRPNVLFLFSDQHHAKAMGCAGNPIVRTPNLDRLAAGGARFTRAYCQDGICVPSRTSIFAGLYPRTTGCLDNPNNPPNPGRYLMLQQLLQRNGYRTGCFGKRHLPRNEMAHGWDRSATTINPKLDPSDESYHEWLKQRGRWQAYQTVSGKAILKSDLFCRISPLKPEERDAAYTADKTNEFLRARKREGRPFFCWATFHGPHQPYTPPQKWADLYPVDKMPLPPNVNEPIEHLPPNLQRWRRNKQQPWNLGAAAGNPALYRRYIAYYYAQVTEVDHYIGRILHQLDALGLRDETIVIYASDHGDFVAHHGMSEKCALGHNVYEDTLRVPLIVSWPKRFARGVVRDDLVELLDLYPTLLDALRLKMPAAAQTLAGRSLVPTLAEGKPVGRKFAVSENWSQVTVITKRYKLGVWIDPGPLPRYVRRDWRKRHPDMLFDLKNDPLETRNLVGRPKVAEVEKQLREHLAQWQSATSSEGKQALISRALKRKT
ncbi:MAG: hypothetical protein AMK72_01960, partial [Planctomycetes bacterium SM23_25]